MIFLKPHHHHNLLWLMHPIMVYYVKGLHKRLVMVEVQGHRSAHPSIFYFMIYEGHTESHEQLFFASELGTADEGEYGGRWNQLLCYP